LQYDAILGNSAINPSADGDVKQATVGMPRPESTDFRTVYIKVSNVTGANIHQSGSYSGSMKAILAPVILKPWITAL
jgi:hypothetical protein